MPGPRGDQCWGLAGQGLAIQPPFRGQDEIGPSKVAVEFQHLQNEFGPRPQPGATEGLQAEPQATGGAGPRLLGQRPRSQLSRGVLGEPFRHQGREVDEPGIQSRHLCGAGPLLGTIDGRRAPGARQRIVHIAHRLEVDPGQPLIGTAGVDAGKGGKAGAGGRYLAPGGVKKPIAQGAGHTDAAIGGSAAADADQQGLGPQVEGGADQLTGPPGGGEEGIALGLGHQGQATGQGHLDQGQPALRHPGQGCLHRGETGAGDPDRDAPGPPGIDRQFQQPIPSVGDRHRDQFGLWRRPPRPPRQGPGRGAGTATPLEGIGSEQNLHGLASSGLT